MSFRQTLKTTGMIFEGLFLLVLVFFFLVIVSPLLPTKRYLATYAVITGSMEPTIPVGSLAFVQQPELSNLSVGDIITFPEPNNPNRTIIHRVASINGQEGMMDVRTKGDNNPEEDSWVINSKFITGKMVHTVPMAGYPVLFAQTPIGYAILVGMPAAILTIINVKNIIEGIREEHAKRKFSLSTAPIATR